MEFFDYKWCKTASLEVTDKKNKDENGCNVGTDSDLDGYHHPGQHLKQETINVAVRLISQKGRYSFINYILSRAIVSLGRDQRPLTGFGERYVQNLALWVRVCECLQDWGQQKAKNMCG